MKNKLVVLMATLMLLSVSPAEAGIIRFVKNLPMKIIRVFYRPTLVDHPALYLDWYYSDY